jgi:hypothetical protein
LRRKGSAKWKEAIQADRPAFEMKSGADVNDRTSSEEQLSTSLPGPSRTGRGLLGGPLIFIRPMLFRLVRRCCRQRLGVWEGWRRVKLGKLVKMKRMKEILEGSDAY